VIERKWGPQKKVCVNMSNQLNQHGPRKLSPKGKHKEIKVCDHAAIEKIPL